MNKRVLRPFLLGSLIFFGACSSQPTTEELLRSEAQSLEQKAELQKSLARDMEKAKSLIKQGESDVEEGNELVSDGQDKIKKGRQLLEATNKVLKEKFPETKL